MDFRPGIVKSSPVSMNFVASLLDTNVIASLLLSRGGLNIFLHLKTLRFVSPMPGKSEPVFSRTRRSNSWRNQSVPKGRLKERQRDITPTYRKLLLSYRYFTVCKIERKSFRILRFIESSTIITLFPLILSISDL